MQVRMVTLAAGPLGVMQAGQVVEVTEAMGAALIAVGAATAVDVESVATVEHAVAPPVETATAKRKRK
ncbi:MAG: hypothetical protein KDD75_02385 [Caldilineaceae bacterium]|nr:hypothetical protein [Caldilineaceae bacterium]